jgi:hypothetical protein
MRASAAAVFLVACLYGGQLYAYDSKFYYGLGWAGADFELASGQEITSHGPHFKLGRELGRFLSIETHLGLSADDTNNLLGDPEIMYGAAFVRLNLPFEKINLYVMGGASTVKYNFSGLEDTESEAAGGFGLDLFANERTALTIEFMRYGVDNTLDITSIGFMHRFEFPGLRRW